MLRIPFSLVVVLWLCMSAVVLLTQSGCEEVSGLDGLEVDTSTARLTDDTYSVVLSVVGGVTNSTSALPLEWYVSDSRLGEIVAQSGITAVYRRSAAHGVNTVTVRDQFGNEGYVAIDQSAATNDFNLLADPSYMRPNDAVMVSIDGSAAEAPFAWQIESGPGRLSGGSGSRSALYDTGDSHN